MKIDYTHTNSEQNRHKDADKQHNKNKRLRGHSLLLYLLLYFLAVPLPCPLAFCDLRDVIAAMSVVQIWSDLMLRLLHAVLAAKQSRTLCIRRFRLLWGVS